MAPFYKKKIREDIIGFFGPIMMLKTQRVGFFDRFRPAARILRAYGTLGIAMVAVVSAVMTFLMFFALRATIAHPTAVDAAVAAPQNWLAIPGVNQFIPLTVPVILALALAVAIHEIGHGILSRVEGIKVKSAGLLLLLFPLGAFVEPDEEELKKVPPIPRARMYGAGIANNLVLGGVCLGIFLLLMGLVTPASGPVVYMMTNDSPVAYAGVPLGSIVQQMDGQAVTSIDNITEIMSGTRPGDPASLTVLPMGAAAGTTYHFNLAASADQCRGFMGVRFYDTHGLSKAVQVIFTPMGFLFFLVLPVDLLRNQVPELHLLLVDTPDEAFYGVPLPFFWGFIHFFFWCGWFNLAIATFNTLPFLPLDGGFIMREGVGGLLRRLGRPQLTDRVTAAISLLVLAVIVLVVAIPMIVSAI